MGLDDLTKLATMAFQATSILAIGFAVPKYLMSRNHRSGETLLLLEARFKELQSRWDYNETSQDPITRVIDPEAQKYSTSVLATAIEKVLKKESKDHDDLQNAWMSRLDELLRFLSLVAAMETNRLLKSRALWDAYYYWFCAIWINKDINDYVRIYSPVLYKFLSDDEEEIRDYWARIEAQTGGQSFGRSQ